MVQTLGELFSSPIVLCSLDFFYTIRHRHRRKFSFFPISAQYDCHQLDIFLISKSKNPSRIYSPRKLGISNGYSLDSKLGSVTTCFITDVLVAGDGEMCRCKVERTHVCISPRYRGEWYQPGTGKVHEIRRGLFTGRRHLTAARHVRRNWFTTDAWNFRAAGSCQSPDRNSRQPESGEKIKPILLLYSRRCRQVVVVFSLSF
jgi:hypothetical protein